MSGPGTRTPSRCSPLLGDLIYRETADGDWVWELSSFDHLEPPDRWDWTYANWADTNGTWVWVSLAAVHQILKIDVATGEIAWILDRGDDFTLVDDDRCFGFQPAPFWLPLPPVWGPRHAEGSIVATGRRR